MSFLKLLRQYARGCHIILLQIKDANHNPEFDAYWQRLQFWCNLYHICFLKRITYMTIAFYLQRTKYETMISQRICADINWLLSESHNLWHILYLYYKRPKRGPKDQWTERTKEKNQKSLTNFDVLWAETLICPFFITGGNSKQDAIHICCTCYMTIQRCYVNRLVNIQIPLFGYVGSYGVAVMVCWGYSAATVLCSSSCWS